MSVEDAVVVADLLREAVRQAPVTVTVKDALGSLLAANDRAAETLATVEGVLGGTAEDLSGGYAELAAAAERRVLESGQPEVFELQQQSRNGQRTVMTVKFPVRTQGATLIGGLRLDVTSPRPASDEGSLAADVTAEANRLRDQFMSRMSHELRTPLTAVLGFGQLLQLNEQLTEEDQQSADQVVKAGQLLLSLIDQLLDLSRLSSGDLVLARDPVELHGVLEAACARVQPLADSLAVELHTDEVTGVVVVGDRERLQQVLANLLDNAVRYDPAGRVCVSCQRVGGRVEVHVDDAGAGLPASARERLFMPFERHNPVGGSGLGLAMASALAGAMGATLQHADLPDGGTRFTVSLLEGALPDATLPAASPLGTAATSQLTVVYVEDNVANVQLMQRILARWPEVTLVSADQGSVGLELVERHRADVVLLDMNLPDMHGSDVLRILKSSPYTVDTPIVVISADATLQQRRRMLDQGAFAYLTKPFVITDLVHVLDEVFGLPAS